MSTSVVTLKNPNLDDMFSDFLYHFGINISNTKDTCEIERKYGDVKFVCIGGTKSRMAELAHHLSKVLSIEADQLNGVLEDHCKDPNRYSIFKVGPVLCCMHGVGMASMGVMLHEILKLLKYAKCKDPIVIRIGTCGGLGVESGTVVISDLVYNGYLRNEYELPILGKRVIRPAHFNSGVNAGLLACHDENDPFQVIIGNTLSADCFYEGQGRLDGAVCEYTKEDKLKFLAKCHDECGIRNIEMETSMLSALMLKSGVKAAAVCVVILNRLNGDQVTSTREQKATFESYPLTIVSRYIKRMVDTYIA